MRARVLAVIAAAAAAALLPALLAAPFFWLRALIVFLGAWTAVSLAATLLLVAWLRATARANEALTQSVRRADWKGQLAGR